MIDELLKSSSISPAIGRTGSGDHAKRLEESFYEVVSD